MVKTFRILCIVCFVVLFASCEEEKKAPVERYNLDRTPATARINDSNFRVKDPSKYAKSFLDSLKASGFSKNYVINENILLMDDGDTTIIPEELPTQTRIMFEAQKDGKSYILMLAQLNYTTVSFGLATYGNKEHLLTETGYVDLLPLYFLGMEIDEDDKTKESYEAVEYWGRSKDCTIAFRIGKNDAGELLVKMKRICDDQSRNIIVDQMPTFREVKDRAKTP